MGATYTPPFTLGSLSSPPVTSTLTSSSPDMRVCYRRGTFWEKVLFFNKEGLYSVKTKSKSSIDAIETDLISKPNTRMGDVQGQGKGQRLMTTMSWQYAKEESTKSNPH